MTNTCACTGYFAATLLLEVGWLQRAYHYTAVWMRKGAARMWQSRHGRQGYEQTDSDAEVTEDEDVQEERLAVQAGTAVADVVFRKPTSEWWSQAH